MSVDRGAGILTLTGNELFQSHVARQLFEVLSAFHLHRETHSPQALLLAVPALRVLLSADYHCDRVRLHERECRVAETLEILAHAHTARYAVAVGLELDLVVSLEVDLREVDPEARVSVRRHSDDVLRLARPVVACESLARLGSAAVVVSAVVSHDLLFTTENAAHKSNSITSMEAPQTLSDTCPVCLEAAHMWLLFRPCNHFSW